MDIFIFGVCVTISMGVGMVWSKLSEIKEILNEIADALEQKGKEQE